LILLAALPAIRSVGWNAIWIRGESSVVKTEVYLQREEKAKRRFHRSLSLTLDAAVLALVIAALPPCSGAEIATASASGIIVYQRYDASLGYPGEPDVPVESLSRADSYFRHTTGTLTAQGLPGMAISVWMRDERDDTAATPTLIGRGDIGTGQDRVVIALGEPSAPAGHFPDEATVQLSVEWRSGGRLRQQTTARALKIDTRPPRFVYALAPAGDFYADLPDPADTVAQLDGENFRHKYHPEFADKIDFYGTDAQDQFPVSYKIRLLDNDQVLYETPEWNPGNLPVDTLYVEGSTPPAGYTEPLLQRGRFPRDVRGWIIDGANRGWLGQPGTGAYRWELLARDAAGNMTVAEGELWVPYAGELLWCCMYTDQAVRCRVPVWMPRDHGVPRLDNDSMNGEWSPYHGKLPVEMEQSFSPIVFKGDGTNPYSRNKDYAEYVWTLSRRYQFWLEAFAEYVESQAHRPINGGFAPYYPPLIPDTDHLVTNYPRLAGDRLRLEVYRDPYVTEEFLYGQKDAVAGGKLPQSSQYAGMAYEVRSLLGDGTEGGGTAGQRSLRRLEEHNAFLLCQDSSGFMWYWQKFLAVQVADTNSDGILDAFAPVYNANGSIALSQDAMQDMNADGWVTRSHGGSGFHGTNLSEVYGAPDPLEVPGFLPSTDAPFSRDDLNRSQKYLQQRALETRTVIDSRLFALIHRSFPLYEFEDARFPGAKGSPVGRGKHEGWNRQGHTAAYFWGQQNGIDIGRPVHEFQHDLNVFHAAKMVRGRLPTNFGFTSESGYDPVTGGFQLLGIDPLRAGGSYLNPLLGIPEADIRRRLGDYNPDGTPHSDQIYTGPTQRNSEHPAFTALLATHPVLSLYARRHPATPPAQLDRTDPVARVAWPREASYILFKDKTAQTGTQTLTFTDFPAIYQMAGETPTAPSDPEPSGIAFAELEFWPYTGPNEITTGFLRADEALPTSELPLSYTLPAGFSLFKHTPESFGYFDDLAADAPDSGQVVWNFRLPRTTILRTHTTDWAGNVGFNAVNNVHVFYDHETLRRGPLAPSNQSWKVLAIYIQPVAQDFTGPFTGDGTYDNPYTGIDYAIQTTIAKIGAGQLPSSPVAFLLLPGVHYTTGLGDNADSSLRWPGQYEWTLFGTGADPSQVVLTPKANPAQTTLIDLTSWGRSVIRLTVGNMTLRGARRGIAIADAFDCHLGGLVIQNMAEDAIWVGVVRGWGLFVQNNTIMDCAKGITVAQVFQNGEQGVTWDGPSAPRADTFRDCYPSSIENNIVTEYTTYGIQIGNGSGSARAWSPFDNPFGDTPYPDSPNQPPPKGNPIIPVGYNLVYRTGSNTQAFTGDAWYHTQYEDSVPGNRKYGELRANPLLAADGRLTDSSPAIAEGDPYYIDRIEQTVGVAGIMPRSLGAFLISPAQYEARFGPLTAAQSTAPARARTAVPPPSAPLLTTIAQAEQQATLGNLTGAIATYQSAMEGLAHENFRRGAVDSPDDPRAQNGFPPEWRLRLAQLMKSANPQDDAYKAELTHCIADIDQLQAITLDAATLHALRAQANLELGNELQARSDALTAWSLYPDATGPAPDTATIIHTILEA